MNRISMIEWGIYKLLQKSEKAGKKMNPIRIARELNYDKLVTNECLAFMANDGYIQFDDDWTISLTDEGQDLVGKIDSEPDIDHTKITDRDLEAMRKRAERMLDIRILYPDGRMAVIGIDQNYMSVFHNGINELINNSKLGDHTVVSNQKWDTRIKL